MSNLKDTIFYKIIQGQLPCHKVYEDDDFLVILDIFPANLGHCLIIPKTPAKDIFDIDAGTASKLYPLATRIAKAVKNATGCDGVNILQNNQAAAGQVIFYFHLHVIPRFEGDGLTNFHSVQNNHENQEFAQMADSLRSNLNE
ncbi:MAG: HIT family protein [Defluviitaleaceae bacterium]|nr:HIT family protein [Defluviitaleaceae bacterium]